MRARSVGLYDAPYAKVLGHSRILIRREAAHDIQSAKKRVYELSRHSDAEFVIFNEHTASSRNF